MVEICEAFVTGYIRTYRLNDAERLLIAWLKDSPNQPRALLLRAKLQIDLQNWKSAEKDLRHILSEVPKQAEAADLLAGVLLKQKAPEAALSVLPVAIADPSTSLSARLRQAECYQILGDDPAAEKVLLSVVQEHPDTVQAHLKLGTLKSDAGNFEAAVDELEKALRLAPQSPDVRYALAIALRGAGKDAEAKEHFEYSTRAQEAIARAMNLRDKVLQNPGDAELRCQIGTLLLDHGQTDRGLVWLHSAIEVNPRLTSAHERLADYYASREGESDEFAKLAAAHRKLATP
jgi:Tfp pilus assembly protein PilF